MTPASTLSSRHSARPRTDRAGPPRVIRGVFGGLIILGVLASVAIFGLSATNTVRFVPVLSNSMAPIMPVGSLALTLPVQRQDVRVGDVIVFTNPNTAGVRVIHRVTRVYSTADASKFANWSTKQLFLGTKGDNNAVADPWVVTIADATIWRRTASIPGLGEPAIWIADPLIRLGCFVVAGVALGVWALVALWRRPAKNEDRKTVDTETVDTETVDTGTVDIETVDTKTVDTRAVVQ